MTYQKLERLERAAAYEREIDREERKLAEEAAERAYCEAAWENA
jgi:hypothetical protein